MSDQLHSGVPFLQVDLLRKHFVLGGGFLSGAVRTVQAVSDISFEVEEGTTLGIVGESGCGKTTTARLLIGLIERDQGSIRIAGRSVGEPDGIGLKQVRRQMQMLFQDSFASLNPRMTIEATIMFGPLAHGTPRSEARRRAHALLDRVGLDPARFAARYPHELSGGQRQRVNIARALAMEPSVLLLDEAVSALDKSVEAQVLNLLLDLKEEFGLTYVFISHDLNVVQYMSDRVMVMYLGKIVEIGAVELIYDYARHPYTRALLKAMPSMDPARRTEEIPIAGDPPSPINPPSGCRFRTRCPFAEDVCEAHEPLLGESQPEHLVACHMEHQGSGHSQAVADQNV
jgi:peptide/nickel transport system ATP-binding protein